MGFSEALYGKIKQETGGQTLLFVSNDLKQTDCLARTWFPSGGLKKENGFFELELIC